MCAGAVFINLDTKETVCDPFENGHSGHRRDWPPPYPGVSDDESLRGHSRWSGHCQSGRGQDHLHGCHPVPSRQEQLTLISSWGFSFQRPFVGGAPNWSMAKGKRYINELETRDITSSATIREVVDRKNGVLTPTGMQGVWLDTPLVEIEQGERDDSPDLSPPFPSVSYVRNRYYQRTGPCLSHPALPERRNLDRRPWRDDGSKPLCRRRGFRGGPWKKSIGRKFPSRHFRIRPPGRNPCGRAIKRDRNRKTYIRAM